MPRDRSWSLYFSRSARWWLAVVIALVGVGQSLSPDGATARAAPGSSPGCPPEMVRVRSFCIDRWEVSAVDKDTSQPLSPYYPPDPRLMRRVYRLWQFERHAYGSSEARRLTLPEPSEWQKSHDFRPQAVSRPGEIPQGYLSFYTARRMCRNAGKRLCAREEWELACRGRRGTKHPYGASFARGRCNVYRFYHPADILHAQPSIGHTDPRLNLLDERGREPLLWPTGSGESCASPWHGDAILDMEGNLDEWVADEKGVFVGGFYARATTEGCEAEVSSHSPLYYDYSLGTRCCLDVRRSGD